MIRTRPHAAAFYLTLAMFAISLSGTQADESLKTYSYSNFRVLYGDGLAIAYDLNSGKAKQIYRDFNTFKPDPEPGEGGVTQSYTLLSLVGPIVSYTTDWYGEGGAHPSYGTSYSTYDLRSGKPASLLDYYSADTLLQVFLKDTVLKKAVREPAKIKNLNQFFEEVEGGCEMYIDKDMLEHFAFHHVKGNNVAIRIGLSHGCEAMRGHFTEIGIYLPVPKALKDAMDRSVKLGHLMSNLTKGK